MTSSNRSPNIGPFKTCNSHTPGVSKLTSIKTGSSFSSSAISQPANAHDGKDSCSVKAKFRILSK